MKFYLSSYKIGNQGKKLKEMDPTNKIFYIPNALDFTTKNRDRKKVNMSNQMNELKQLGFEPEVLDLKNYFGKPKELYLHLYLNICQNALNYFLFMSKCVF